MGDYGHMYTSHHITIVRGHDEMTNVIRGWSERMKHAEHLFQGKGVDQDVQGMGRGACELAACCPAEGTTRTGLVR